MRIGYKDVALAYLTSGMSGVSQCRADGASDDVMVSALNHLREHNNPCDDFASWVCSEIEVDFLDEGEESTGVRGRPRPQVGTERTYKAQLGNGQDPFVRVPLSTLTQEKALIKAEFGEGVITLRLAQ